MPNPITFGWLLYKMENGEPQFFGLLQTKEGAEADKAVIERNDPDTEWRIAQVPFVGWGYVAPGVFSQNGPAPLRVVTDDEKP